MANEDYLMNEEQVPDSWQPVIRQKPMTPAAPPQPNAMNGFFQGSLPPTSQHDAVFVGTEVGTPGIAKTALMPLSLQSNAFTNAGVQSTASKTASGGGGGAVSSVELTIPDIFTPITQIQTGNPVPLQFGFIPQPPNFFLAGPVISGGVVDTLVGAGGGSSDPVVLNVTPSTTNEFGLFFASTQGKGPGSPNPGAGWTNVGGTGIFTTVYTQFFPLAAPISISQGALGSPFAVMLALFGTNGNPPAIVQPLVQGSGPTSPQTTATFASPNTAGNTLVILISGDNGLSPVSGTVTDTQGNAYNFIALEQSVPAPPNNQALLYTASNIKAGSNAVTFTWTGSAGITITAIEFSNITAVPGFPTFRPIESQDIATVAVTSLNGGVGDLFLISSNSSISIARSGSNIDLTLGASAVPFSAITSGTNTAATMHVGTGASLDATGSGVINATKINGVAITGTPSTGQVPTATSSTTATWQAPAGGLGAAMKVNNFGVSADKLIYIKGVQDGSLIWQVKINGTADGG